MKATSKAHTIRRHGRFFLLWLFMTICSPDASTAQCKQKSQNIPLSRAQRKQIADASLPGGVIDQLYEMDREELYSYDQPVVTDFTPDQTAKLCLKYADLFEADTAYSNKTLSGWPESLVSNETTTDSPVMLTYEQTTTAIPVSRKKRGSGMQMQKICPSKQKADLLLYAFNAVGDIVQVVQVSDGPTQQVVRKPCVQDGPSAYTLAHGMGVGCVTSITYVPMVAILLSDENPSDLRMHIELVMIETCNAHIG